jgi:hypothetical protein
METQEIVIKDDKELKEIIPKVIEWLRECHDGEFYGFEYQKRYFQIRLK